MLERHTHKASLPGRTCISQAPYLFCMSFVHETTQKNKEKKKKKYPLVRCNLVRYLTELDFAGSARQSIIIKAVMKD